MWFVKCNCLLPVAMVSGFVYGAKLVSLAAVVIVSCSWGALIILLSPRVLIHVYSLTNMLLLCTIVYVDRYMYFSFFLYVFYEITLLFLFLFLSIIHCTYTLIITRIHVHDLSLYTCKYILSFSYSFLFIIHMQYFFLFLSL